MCRNGNEIQQNRQARQGINGLPQNVGPVNLQEQQQDNSFMRGVEQIDLQRQEQEGPNPLQQHISNLKEEQRILEQSRGEYTAYNIQGQFLKYVKPRIKKKGLITQVATMETSYTSMAQVYARTGFKLTDSVEKRSKMLSEGTERQGLQRKFAEKIQYVNSHPVTKNKNVSLKDVISLTDKELVDHYGEYSGAGKELVDIRCNLMKNPLYSVLPVKELKKTSRQELLKKLDAEYNRQDSSREYFVALYQDLIRLQILENSVKTVERKNPKNPPVNITEKERKTNKTYRVNITNELNKCKNLTSEEKVVRRQAAERVLDSNILRFWEDKDREDLRGISPEQKEGVRMILAWMYRNCGAGKSDTKEPFVYNLTKAKPKQLLFILYIVENGLTVSPTAEGFSDALKNYVPNPKASAFKSKPDWTAISQAAGYVDKCGELNTYLECEKEQDVLIERIATRRDVHDGEKMEDLGKRTIVLGNKLVALYNAAGLAPDMPLDLVADKTLKRHIQEAAEEFRESIEMLKEEIGIQHQDLNLQEEADRIMVREGQEGAPLQGKKSHQFKNKETGLSGLQHVDEKSKYVKAVADTPKTAIKSLGKAAETITKSGTYSYITNGIGFVFAAYNLFRKVPELAKLLSSITKGTNTLSLAETASKSLKLTGATIKNAADIVRGGADVYKYSHGLQNEKFVDLADKLSSTPEALQFGAGVVSIMAGGMQTISAGIDLKQVSKSRKHLNKAEQHLEARKQNDLSEQMYGELTEEQIRLKDLQRKEIGALIKHRQNMTTHTRNSALVDMTGGILSMLGGTMSVTGILAPLGGILSIAGSAISIGLGIIYARMARDKSIQEAVDEGLNLKKAVDDVIKYFNLGPITLEEYSELKNRVRQEALAELHYSGYKVCYLDMCMKSASLLYNKVVEKPSDQEMADYEQTDEYKMYYETLMSLGFEEIKRAEYPFQTSFPTAAQIYDRLTKGVT